ncbi:hypothetical protein [Methanosarcina sp.]
MRYSDYNRILNNAVLGKSKGIYLQECWRTQITTT